MLKELEILKIEYYKKHGKDRYLVCPYCNSERVVIDKATDSVRECMKENSYKRCNGAIKQRR